MVLLLVASNLWKPCQAQSAPATAPAAAARPAGGGGIRTQLAEALLLGHRYPEAIAEFDKALAADPANRRARLGLARAYFWFGRVDQARTTLLPLVEKQPDGDTLALWREILAVSTSVEGLKTLEQSAQANPDDPSLSQSHARSLMGLGCYADAIRILRTLTEKHPGNAEFKVDLALAYYAADRYPETIAICRQYEADTSPAGLRARVLLARTSLKTWRIGEANKTLVDLRAQAGDEPRVHLGLLMARTIDQADSPVTTKECLDALANESIRAKLQARADAQDWLFALLNELLSRAVTDERTETARRLEEILAWDNPTEAIKICREVLRQYAKDGPAAVKPDVKSLVEAAKQGLVAGSALHEAGTVLLLISAGEPLVEVCDAGLAREPQDVMLMMLRAEGLAITAEYKKAEEGYQQLLTTLPACTKAKRGLARAYSWHREFEHAEDTYKEMIEADPGDMVIRREAARSLGWDKQLRLSLESYEMSAEATEGTLGGETWRDLLLAERDAKKANWWMRDYEARKKHKALMSLIENDPSDLEARFDLAQVYARNRLWEEAAEQYSGILNIDARHRRARDALHKNHIYHEPVSTTSFSWSKLGGFGSLLDIETSSVTETVKQEIARRTDLSFTASQKWHHFREWGGGGIQEQDYIFRLDRQFGLRTWGHVSGGWAIFDESDEEQRFVANAALSHRIYQGLTLTAGYEREPWRMNRATIEEGIDQDRLYIKAFDNIDPWLDAWFEYGHSWLSDGTFQPPQQRGQNQPNPVLITDKNDLDELKWGSAYRFSLMPKVLQVEYRGFIWLFDHEVPTYYSPDFFMVNLLRESWRHYLNNDQYVEMKQLYYEVGLTESIDSEGVAGIGWDAAFGWDICHYFGIELKWSGTRSSTYDADLVFLQIVSRF
jgi:tetratricopeptide (TPR) repeat protein